MGPGTVRFVTVFKYLPVVVHAQWKHFRRRWSASRGSAIIWPGIHSSPDRRIHGPVTNYNGSRNARSSARSSAPALEPEASLRPDVTVPAAANPTKAGDAHEVRKT